VIRHKKTVRKGQGTIIFILTEEMEAVNRFYADYSADMRIFRLFLFGNRILEQILVEKGKRI